MEDHKINEEENKEAQQTPNWEEYDKFFNAHCLQLYGMNFPKELGEKLYYKLKHEIFDSVRFFEVLENQEEERLLLNAKLNMKKEFEVFLVDHCWTFKIRQFNEFCQKYPNVIDRVFKMLKYKNVKRDIPGLNNKQKSLEEIDQLNKEETVTYLDYDDMNLAELEHLKFKDSIQALSLENNKIESFDVVLDFLSSHGKNIKAIWLESNPFEEIIQNYESILADSFKELELINRKFTKNSTKWSVDFIVNRNKNKVFSKYEDYYGKEKYLDLSGRQPLDVPDFNIFKDFGAECQILDMRDNNYEFDLENKEFISKFLELLAVFPKLEKILVDEVELSDDLEEESYRTSFINFIRTNKNYELIRNLCPKLCSVNDYSFDRLILNETDVKRYYQETWVRKYIWKLIQTYRLVTSDKYDEDATWYVNDEIGTAINHSDSPNVALFPFIFSPSNTFKDDMITYSILWPLKDIKRGDEILHDYLTNIPESKQRSARLTCWFNTPKDFFAAKFTDKIKAYTSNSNNFNNVLNSYLNNVDKLVSLVKDKSEFDKLYENTFIFETLSNKVKQEEGFSDLVEKTRKNVEKSISSMDDDSQNINQYFVDNFINKKEKIKVLSDLPYVRENISKDLYEITDNVFEADIMWLNTDFFALQNSLSANFKKTVFKNQFPFESVITMKSLLTDVVQSNMGLNSFLNLSYNMETELAEIIGNYNYNNENKFDNTWILKPINMSRSMDMIVTDNLDEIIRSVETGPKICQKYLHRPLLLNNKKFDLRFIVLLKRLVPLELYFYSKMFWVRSANKDFTMDNSTFTDYEVHFTVMNYNTFGMQTIYDKQFLEYLKTNNIDWEPIFEQIKHSVKNIFLMAGKDCPQMCDPYSRAIYGLDVMIDADSQPKVLEINYSPDCTRACKFVPEFFNDIFSTLFLESPSGVQLV